MTDPFELIRLRHVNEIMRNQINVLNETIEASAGRERELLGENSRLRFELAKYKGREMMQGGRDHLKK